MKESIFKSTLVLTVCCLLAAAMLASAYVATKDKIEEQAKLAIDERLKEIFPDASNFAEKESYYIAQQNGKTIGYLAMSEAVGYSSVIKVIVGMYANKSVAGVRILEQAETPGLGSETSKPDFYNRFQGLDSSSVSLKKNNGKVDGITGATISSRAVSEAVKITLQQILEPVANDLNPNNNLTYNKDAVTSATQVPENNTKVNK